MPAGRSSGAARSFCLLEAETERGGGWTAWPVENSSVPGGAAGAHSAHTAGGGGLRPPPLRWFCGPFGPAKRRRPAAHPPTATLQPPRQPTSAGPTAVAWERREDGADMRGGRRRLAAGGRPQGRPPACQTKERGPGPRAPGPALSGRFASCRRPPLWVFH